MRARADVGFPTNENQVLGREPGALGGIGYDLHFAGVGSVAEGQDMGRTRQGWGPGYLLERLALRT